MRVRMYHRSSDRYQYASQDAFDRQWSEEGWVLADDDEPTPDPDPEPVPAVDAGDGPVRPAQADNKEAWVDYAGLIGVPVAEGDTKADVIAAVKAAEAEG